MSRKNIFDHVRAHSGQSPKSINIMKRTSRNRNRCLKGVKGHNLQILHFIYVVLLPWTCVVPVYRVYLQHESGKWGWPLNEGGNKILRVILIWSGGSAGMKFRSFSKLCIFPLKYIQIPVQNSPYHLQTFRGLRGRSDRRVVAVKRGSPLHVI